MDKKKRANNDAPPSPWKPPHPRRAARHRAQSSSIGDLEYPHVAVAVVVAVVVALALAVAAVAALVFSPR